MYVANQNEFTELWTEFIDSIDTLNNKICMDDDKVSKVLYTTIMSFAICYDLWKNSSRKTPGTYFEVILGSILARLLPDYTRKKHVIIPGQDDKVSTDIVFEPEGDGVKLVIPAKTTTRERIVQPFAHQRILDGVFGEGVYKSMLICVNEIQREQDTGVNDICVPGTLKLFQSYLAKMHGIYYIDPPQRYLQEDITSIIRVGTLASLLINDLRAIIAAPAG
jgi:hypothetical protein